MASTSTTAATTASIINGRLVTPLQLLPSKFHLPSFTTASAPRTPLPYRQENKKTFADGGDSGGGAWCLQSPLVLQLSPATSPKKNNNGRKSRRRRTRSAPSPSSRSSFDGNYGCNNHNKVDAQRIDLWGIAECDSGHGGVIRDVKINFDGSKLATASDDSNIKVFDLDPKTDAMRCVVTLKGHEGPVWKLDWADPSMGNILASASADGTVRIWREKTKSQQLLLHESIIANYIHSCGEGEGHSFNWKDCEVISLFDGSSGVEALCVSWAPWTFGLALACGYSNGSVCICSYQDGIWKSKEFEAHSISVKAVSWAPATTPCMESLSFMEKNEVFRFVTCGEADLFVKIWRLEEGAWVEETRLTGLMGHVRDVAWCPNPKKMRIAACGTDMRVVIWSFNGHKWELTFSTLLCEDPWTVSWNNLGDQLVVSQTDYQVFIKEVHQNSDDRKCCWTVQNINGCN